ncbi:MAG: ATPase [Oscillospiraceae bacterium]|nr:ATPase [Oscillospiraceae bacterium]
MSVYEILELIFLPLLIVALLALPVYAAITKKKSGKSMRRAMLTNLCAFGAVMLCAIVLPLGGFVSAAEATEAVASSAAGLGYLAAALAVGVGSIGCGIAVGHAAPAAIGAIAEEPKSFAKALIFVALGEGVAIYGLLIAIMILSKV